VNAARDFSFPFFQFSIHKIISALSNINNPRNSNKGSNFDTKH
jgi:hypothetical protein